MINNPEIKRYVGTYLTKENDLLKRLNRETHLKTLAPQMLSGHVQGNFISMLSRMLRPKNILEIGTFSGYAALCLAEGLVEGGCLYTIEIKKDIIYLAKKYFAESIHKENIRILEGDAKKIISDLDVQFDLVFLDADKLNYDLYFDLVFDKLRPGGVILADNVLWSGKVLDKKKDKTTKALHDFNVRMSKDTRVQNIILPLRDGINLIQKL